MTATEEVRTALNGSHKKYITIALVTGAVIVVGTLSAVGLAAYGAQYKDAVVPGVAIGEVVVGGMSREELSSFLESMNTKIASDGVTIEYKESGAPVSFTVVPSITAEGITSDVVSIDTEKEVERLVAYGKSTNAVWAGVRTLVARVQKPTLRLYHINVYPKEIMAQVREQVKSGEQPPKNANIIITSLDPLVYTTTSSHAGTVFNEDELVDELTESWSRLVPPILEVKTSQEEPTVFESDLATISTSTVEKLFSRNDLVLTFEDSRIQQTREWKLTNAMLSKWIEVQKLDDGTVTLGISRALFDEYVEETIAPIVAVEATDARFEIGTDNKVKEFEGSHPGVTLDRDKTYELVYAAFVARGQDDDVAQTIVLPTSEVAPNIQTGEINGLGIEQILGVGYSNLSGSPANRIKNVRFAVEQKLNGMLIKPDQVFSLLDSLGPFTIEAGYLSELVIKGDEIKPEVGGGLCQVGTTMFRAAMNAGLEIVERRNHSLAINYYNDHRNGLPGTDATIYDPAPDFKFKNNTGNYLLLTTELDIKTGDIWFTLWGTSDGRKGYYTEPVVEQWIPTGPERVTKTTSLEPGKRTCQSAHPGAVTSFTYVVEQPDGTKQTREFRSTYRALPRICLLGVTPEELAAEQPPVEGTEPAPPAEGEPLAPPAQLPEGQVETPSST